MSKSLIIVGALAVGAFAYGLTSPAQPPAQQQQQAEHRDTRDTDMVFYELAKQTKPAEAMAIYSVAARHCAMTPDNEALLKRTAELSLLVHHTTWNKTIAEAAVIAAQIEMAPPSSGVARICEELK